MHNLRYVGNLMKAQMLRRRLWSEMVHSVVNRVSGRWLLQRRRLGSIPMNKTESGGTIIRSGISSKIQFQYTSFIHESHLNQPILDSRGIQGQAEREFRL